MPFNALPSRLRVIVDNDFSGDPDDLFQLAHHVLSPSVEIPVVIGSHLAPDDGFDPSDRQAANAVGVARELLELLGSNVPVVQGAEAALSGDSTRTAASEAIRSEATRADPRPLVVALGAGMTDLALALRDDPSLASKLSVVWIGGPEYAQWRTVPEERSDIEYNLHIDVQAAREVFDTPVSIWQVPRDVYRQCLVTVTELEERLRSAGRLGEHLIDAVNNVREKMARRGLNLGETYALGDSPLVLLTALQSPFEPDASSSRSRLVARPAIAADGSYVARESAMPPIRVFTHLDTRTMFEDMFLKFTAHARQYDANPS